MTLPTIVTDLLLWYKMVTCFGHVLSCYVLFYIVEFYCHVLYFNHCRSQWT